MAKQQRPRGDGATSRVWVLLVALTIVSAWSLSGCGDGSDPSTAATIAESHRVFREATLGEDAGTVPTDHCVGLPDLASALHIGPPLDDDPGDPASFDATLIEWLEVSVARRLGDGTWTIEAEYTATTGNRGQGAVVQEDARYHLNWKPEKALVGEELELRFAVDGMEVGVLSCRLGAPRTVPVKFRIDRHPLVRARALRAEGATGADAARALIDEFPAVDSPACIASILKYAGYPATETAIALRDIYGLEAYEASQILKDVGYACGDIGLALRDAFEEDALEAAAVLADIGCTYIEIGEVLRDVYEEDARSAATIILAIGASEEEAMEVLMVVYETYLAITDVRVTDEHSPFPSMPEEYTGIVHRTSEHPWICVEPYVPGLFGTRYFGHDVNDDIGGSTTSIWVRYDFVAITSDTPVLVELAVTHWPYWNAYCKDGWERANGTSSGNQGALTTGTYGACWRNGLCVKYEPMNEVTTFVSAVGLSRTDDGEAAPPPLCAANLGYWTMGTDALDIHRGCGSDIRADSDDYWYLCYNRARVWPKMPVSFDLTDAEKEEILHAYAPRVWIASGESYYPSSVEWAQPYLRRYRPCDEGYVVTSDCSEGGQFANYWLRTKESMCDSDTLGFFDGDRNVADATVPVYAFTVEKEIPAGGVSVEVLDLVYFFYFPYNRGKEVAGTTYGHHVGDWEHVTVRMAHVYDAADGWSLEPAQIYLSAHSFGKIHEWSSIPKVDGTHPVVYSAHGSHGIWPSAGRFHYETVDLGLIEFQLVDYTSEGTVWDTWRNIETYDFTAKAGLGESRWPVWMGTDFTAACAEEGCDPSDPASGAIYRWGNPQCASAFGECRLCSGPTGPVSKGVWGAMILK